MDPTTYKALTTLTPIRETILRPQDKLNFGVKNVK